MKKISLLLTSFFISTQSFSQPTSFSSTTEPLTFGDAVAICVTTIKGFEARKIEAVEIAVDSEPQNLVLQWPNIAGKEAKCAVDREAKQIAYFVVAGRKTTPQQLASLQEKDKANKERIERIKSGDTKDFVASTKQVVTRNYKDPASAQWRDLFLAKSDTPTLCGEVNGKNSYGGYTGFKRFYSTGLVWETDVEEHGRKFTEKWAKLCSERGQEIQ